MPSNDDIIEQINKTSELLGKEPPATKGLTNAKLAETLSGLKDELKESEDAGAKDAAAKKAEAQKKTGKVKKKPPYYVAPGTALTSNRGIISGDVEDLDDAAVTAKDLAGGQAAIDAFVDSGHILRGS